MRFPRINRLRWDKQPRDADQIQILESMLQPTPEPISPNPEDAASTKTG
jgi:hypothetical protein